MAAKQVVKSVCGLCAGGHCGILVTVEDGKVVKIKGDREHPVSKGSMCKRGLAALEFLYHPNRLKHPLKRMGERGEGKWQEISWDEAFGEVAEALNRVKREYGPEAVVMAHGAAHGLIDTHLVRLANAFGTPNVVSADHVCHIPKKLAAELTFGFYPSFGFHPGAFELGHSHACTVFWGASRVETIPHRLKTITESLNKGTRLIVIDPLQTRIAKMAELWLQIRPGSDLALALGMLNVIINEGLYDRDFVDKWTIGFDELKDHVQAYSLDKVAEITWVPADLIAKAARLYASSKPGYIEWGNAVDHGLNSFQTCRAIAIMMAIVGNLGIPGGELEAPDSGFRYGHIKPLNRLRSRWSYELELRDNIPQEKRQNKVGADLTMLPDFRYVIPQSVVKSILEGQPYRIRAAYIQACNALSSWPNILRVNEALKRLDFLAVSELFMTPTAALADIVFPAATYLEYDSIDTTLDGTSAQLQKKVVQIAECRSDHEIVNGLAKKLGLGQYFWDTIDDFWNAVLEPVGLTFEEFKRRGRFTTTERQPQQYKQYEKDGFRTPSGKVELRSSQLEEWGCARLPIYFEPPETPYSEPRLTREYPLQFTIRRADLYRHSDGMQISSLRVTHPDPLVLIHPETASKLGIEDGDWVYIESRRGRIKQRASLSGSIDPRVVIVDNAWWFPERGEEALFGWADSNYNVLTSDSPPFNRELGSFNIRGIACKVYRAPEGSC